MGAAVPEYDDPNLRERQVGRYRILYRVRGDDIGLVTIVHAGRRLPRTQPG